MAFAAGLALGRITFGHSAGRAPELVADRVRVAPAGPWGVLEYVPISIECPEGLLPLRAFESKQTHWLLKGYTPEKWLALLSQLGIDGELRDQLRAPEVFSIVDGGIEISPTTRIVLEFPPKARKELYTLLASFPENRSALTFILSKTVDERFAANEVSSQTVALLKRVSCEYGRYLVFSDIAGLCSMIPTYQERVRFVKALTRQSSILARLRVTPGSNVDELVNYWGRASTAKDVRPLLESLTKVPGGARLDLINLLPRAAAARLNTFPLPENPLNGTFVRKDCHWTAFNFFRNLPDDRFVNHDVLISSLHDDYFPLMSDPRYGDLALFLTPDGQLVHSAVYLADNIVYTKNGDTSLHPWMLSTVEDLIDQYSFQVPPDKALEVKYYRSKNY